MEEKDLKQALDNLKAELDKANTEKAKKEIADQIKAFEEKHKDVLTSYKALQDEVAQLKKAAEANQEVIDKFIASSKSTVIPGTNGNIFTEFGEQLAKRSADLKDFKSRKRGMKDFELQSKAVGNMSSSGNITGSYFVPPTVVPGVNLKPYEEVHMRDILPVGTTNSNLVRYIRDNGGEGGPAMVAEGGTKPQIDRDLQIYDANVRKIATYFRVPEEMIDDIPYLQSFLTQIGMQEVMKVEDAQILYGDGTGQNLSGLFTNATAFDAGTSIVDTPNNFDVLLAARKQGRVALYNPSIALISPIDYFDMIEKKDTTKNYLFLGGGNGIDVNGVLTLKTGLRVIEHTAVTAGDFLVFDPSKAAIFDRMGTTIRFFDQDQDNAIKNLITIVIEKRLALPIYQPAAFIKGTFATAITDLTS